jgi:hypothetical protein
VNEAQFPLSASFETPNVSHIQGSPLVSPFTAA